MSASWVTFLFEASNFLLLAAALGWLFFRPVRDALEKRRQALEDERRNALEDRARAEQLLAEVQTRQAEQESSFEKLRERVLREAEAERERIVEEAKARVRREHDSLEEDLVSLRRAQAQSLARDGAHAAKQVLVRLLEQIQGPELESGLWRTACQRLEQLREAGPLAPIVIEAVESIGEERLAALIESAGVDAGEVTQRQTPDLVAGLRIMTARGLVDVSAAGLSAQVEQELVRRLDEESENHD